MFGACVARGLGLAWPRPLPEVVRYSETDSVWFFSLRYLATSQFLRLDLGQRLRVLDFLLRSGEYTDVRVRRIFQQNSDLRIKSSDNRQRPEECSSSGEFSSGQARGGVRNAAASSQAGQRGGQKHAGIADLQLLGVGR
ncbi:hypothetical protein AOLI_G00014590 [Acnodon oligacanthus]